MQLLQLLLHVEVVVIGSVRESGCEMTATFWREISGKPSQTYSLMGSMVMGSECLLLPPLSTRTSGGISNSSE